MSGLLDVAGWPMTMITTYATVSAWQGHHDGLKVAVVLAVSVANFFGTYFAVKLGEKRIRAEVTELVCTCCRVHRPVSD